MLSNLFRSLNAGPQALTIHLPPVIYSAGSAVDGELEIDFRKLQEDNIDEVQVRLRGSARVCVHTYIDSVNLTYLSLWTRGTEKALYPPPGSDVLRIPFHFALPDTLPPSFHWNTIDESATIRYALTAVGVRNGLLNFDRKYLTPLARARGEVHAWRTQTKAERIRKGLWGDYAKVEVEVELSLPDIPVLPLFSTIPSRTRLPVQRPSFPPVPTSGDELEFTLRRRLELSAQRYGMGRSFRIASVSKRDVAEFLGKDAAKGAGGTRASVEKDVPGRVWVWEDELDAQRERRGVWVQRATFHSTFTLTCSPTSAIESIQCQYFLTLKVPFPGAGNNVLLHVPVTVTSGIDKPLPRDNVGVSQKEAAERIELDLPPYVCLTPLRHRKLIDNDLHRSYWDANDKGWGDDTKE
ncbi:hypothetical protein C8Q74DRAFT_1319879 [Fomes fomentarius]|nr:hypothetical protein C8Q74DRAFT_1319879 [Fomes fomentarius]